MTSDRKEYLDYISFTLNDILGRYGFRKRYRSPIRERTNVIDVVQILGSSSSTASVLKFTLEVGVYPKAFSSDKRFLRSLRLNHCPLHNRVPLIFLNQDKWWAVNDADSFQVAVEAVSRLTDQVATFLEPLDDVRVLIDAVAAWHSPFHDPFTERRLKIADDIRRHFGLPVSETMWHCYETCLGMPRVMRDFMPVLDDELEKQ